MKYLLKNALILNPGGNFHRQRKDVLIDKGQIVAIAKTIKDEQAQAISSKNLHLSIGWLDLAASFGEPGNEHKESLHSGLEAAKRGGFTGLALNPDTSPSIDSKGQIEFLLSKTKTTHCKLYPIAALSKNCEGQQLAEMYDMELAGARAFSDNKSVENSELFKLALLYSKNLKSRIFDFAMDASLSKGGQMNEGMVSTSLGLKGIPELAEIVRVKRDLDIASYCDAQIHFQGLSAPEAIQAVKKAKAGHSIAVNIANLVWDDKALNDFDTNFKLMPPLRSSESMKKLRKAVLNGEVHCIASAHNPQDTESKRCEFEYASFGMASLEIFFNLLLMAFEDEFDNDHVINAISSTPRSLLGLKPGLIEEGQEANLTLFDPEVEQEFSQGFVSKAANYPLTQVSKKGKIVGSFRGRSVFLSA